MTQSIKHTLALLAFAGATVVNATGAGSKTTHCKVILEADETYRVIYHAAEEENVTVQITDQDQELVYTEKLRTSEFVKKYDLSYLPKGAYQLEIKSDEYSYTEDILVGDVSGFTFFVTPAIDRAVSVVGSHKDGKDVTLCILDQDDQLVYRESINDTKQVHKRFNFSELSGNSVTLLLYHDNELIKQEEIKF